MRIELRTSARSLPLVLILAGFAPAGETSPSWPQWRGPSGNGLAPSADPPVTWSESRNVRWKTALPGQGLSTPIVWDDLVIIQAAIPADSEESQSDRDQRVSKPDTPFRFTVLAYNRSNGREVWRRVVREQVPHEGSHMDGSLASASPMTDGEYLYAMFGSRGVYALHKTGEVVWEKDLGNMQTRNGFGEGSSPALHENTLVINWDHEGDSFVVALDKRTGAEKWRRPRDEVTSWSTPVILRDAGRTLVVISATRRIRAYDIDTGEVVWECGGLGLNAIPTSLFNDELLFAMTGFRDPQLLAIRYRGARGDITDSDRIVWRTDKDTSYVPSGLLHGELLYYLKKNNGVLSCVDPRTGKPHYEPQRLDDITGVYASLVGAADRIYVVGRNGTAVVLRHGKSFEVLATNRLDDSFSASPAIVADTIFLRGMKSLYCIGR
ncbi:MAG: PQQ-like beta-propeller repeat protein [Phycisphaerae bacterium]|nr:PQQ-like beta-propeller repeat protein [Phycisphaerae bacterium]